MRRSTITSILLTSAHPNAADDSVPRPGCCATACYNDTPHSPCPAATGTSSYVADPHVIAAVTQDALSHPADVQTLMEVTMHVH
jgi:hypothetical protein